MSVSEFSLIEKYFHQQDISRKDVVLGIGDDCALLDIPAGQQLAVTVDTLVEGVHFLTDSSPSDLGWKAIAVSLSDLAAIGAEPAWLSLALTILKSESSWLESFSVGLFECADYYGLQLIGGDTSRGPLSVTVQAMGLVPPGAALQRSSAKPGDLICVTGHLGDAGMGLEIATGRREVQQVAQKDYLLKRFNRPVPRVSAGIAMRHIASAAIDLSDGLAGDLPHILTASGVGATINLDKLPLSTALVAQCNSEDAIHYAITSGDDYELCFTVAEEKLDTLTKALKSSGNDYTVIGRITGGSCLRYTQHDKVYDKDFTGYTHFKH